MSDVIDYEGLFRAASAGRADEVRSFLEAGANLRYRNKKGTTAAHLASAKGRLEALKLMLDRGLCPNVTCAGGKTPLHMACNAETARLLLSAGASCGASDKYARKPLHTATMNRRDDVVAVLLAGGACAHVCDIWGSTPLHEAGDAKVASLLLDAGALAAARDKDGKTPLHTAVASGFDEVVEALVRAGADIGATDNAGRTPLHCARFFTTVKLLLALGANPELCDADGRKPLDRFQAMGLGGDMGASLAILLQGSLLTPA